MHRYCGHCGALLLIRRSACCGVCGTQDGARVDVILNASCRKNYEGRIVGVLGVGQASPPNRQPGKPAVQRGAVRLTFTPLTLCQPTGRDGLEARAQRAQDSRQ